MTLQLANLRPPEATEPSVAESAHGGAPVDAEAFLASLAEAEAEQEPAQFEAPAPHPRTPATDGELAPESDGEAAPLLNGPQVFAEQVHRLIATLPAQRSLGERSSEPRRSGEGAAAPPSPPLSLSPKLERATRQLAEYLMTLNRRPDGPGPGEPVGEAGPALDPEAVDSAEAADPKAAISSGAIDGAIGPERGGLAALPDPDTAPARAGDLPPSSPAAAGSVNSSALDDRDTAARAKAPATNLSAPERRQAVARPDATNLSGPDHRDAAARANAPAANPNAPAANPNAPDRAQAVARSDAGAGAASISAPDRPAAAAAATNISGLPDPAPGPRTHSGDRAAAPLSPGALPASRARSALQPAPAPNQGGADSPGELAPPLGPAAEDRWLSPVDPGRPDPGPAAPAGAKSAAAALPAPVEPPAASGPDPSAPDRRPVPGASVEGAGAAGPRAQGGARPLPSGSPVVFAARPSPPRGPEVPSEATRELATDQPPAELRTAGPLNSVELPPASPETEAAVREAVAPRTAPPPTFREAASRASLPPPATASARSFGISALDRVSRPERQAQRLAREVEAEGASSRRAPTPAEAVIAPQNAPPESEAISPVRLGAVRPQTHAEAPIAPSSPSVPSEAASARSLYGRGQAPTPAEAAATSVEANRRFFAFDRSEPRASSSPLGSVWPSGAAASDQTAFAPPQKGTSANWADGLHLPEATSPPQPNPLEAADLDPTFPSFAPAPRAVPALSTQSGPAELAVAEPGARPEARPADPTTALADPVPARISQAETPRSFESRPQPSAEGAAVAAARSTQPASWGRDPKTSGPHRGHASQRVDRLHLEQEAPAAEELASDEEAPSSPTPNPNSEAWWAEAAPDPSDRRQFRPIPTTAQPFAPAGEEGTRPAAGLQAVHHAPDTSAPERPEPTSTSQVRRLLAEVAEAHHNRPQLQPLRLRFENEDGTPMRLLLTPGPGGQHKITLVVANAQLKEELKRALPEIHSAVAELPLGVSEIDITVDEQSTVTRRRALEARLGRQLGGLG